MSRCTDCENPVDGVLWWALAHPPRTSDRYALLAFAAYAVAGVSFLLHWL